MSKFSFWKSRNIIRYQQKVYTSKPLLQFVKSEIIMFIESIPRKSIETRKFANELNKYKLIYIYSIFFILLLYLIYW
jgi:hypothetical protein